MGMRTLVMLLYATITLWIPHLLYFWLSVLSLCIAPFLFNPHQFSMADFLIDYREFLRWMSRGNSKTHKSSWYGYCRLSRTMITGYKKKKLGHPSDKMASDVPRARWRTVLFSQVIAPILMSSIFIIAYMFTKSFPDENGDPQPSPLVRIGIIAVGPMVWNAAVLIIMFLLSVCLGPMLEGCCAKFASVMATLAHLLALVGLVAFFEFFVSTVLYHVLTCILTLL